MHTVSSKHLNHIWMLNIPTNEKILLLALYQREGQEGCYPSKDTLKKMTGLGVSTQTRTLRALEKRGLVATQRVRHQSNRYTLTPTATADAITALHQMLKAPLGAGDAASLEASDGIAQKASKASLGASGNSLVIDHLIPASPKLSDAKRKKGSSGTMSRAEALATYGSQAKTGEPESGLAA